MCGVTTATKEYSESKTSSRRDAVRSEFNKFHDKVEMTRKTVQYKPIPAVNTRLTGKIERNCQEGFDLINTLAKRSMAERGRPGPGMEPTEREKELDSVLDIEIPNFLESIEDLEREILKTIRTY